MTLLDFLEKSGQNFRRHVRWHFHTCFVEKFAEITILCSNNAMEKKYHYITQIYIYQTKK